jgi:periplasmic divalent cation tolerance protein
LAADGACVVLTTCASGEEAGEIAKRLLDLRLAACVQELEIKSRYWWQGRQVEAPERLLLVKTRRELYREVESAILEAHPYEVPEVLCLPAEAGFQGYLDWLLDSTRGR